MRSSSSGNLGARRNHEMKETWKIFTGGFYRRNQRDLGHIIKTLPYKNAKL